MEDYEAAGVQGTRLYVGNLPTDATKRDLEQLFGKYGNLRDVSVKRTVSGAPFAFIEFEDERDGQEAIKGRDGYNYNGNRLRVEIPFASRNNGPGRGRGRGAPRRGEFRVLVSGLPPSGSWQDLKDHMRDAGECVYADVFRDGTGVVEFTRRDDWEYALKQFNDSKFRSHEGEVSRIQVRMCEDVRETRRSPSPPGHNRNGGVYDGYRTSSGYRDEPRGGVYRDDGRGAYRDDYRVSNVGGGYRDDYRGSYRPDSRGGLRYGSAGGGRHSDEVVPPRSDAHRRASHHDDEFDRRSPYVPPHRSVSRGRSRSRSRR